MPVPLSNRGQAAGDSGGDAQKLQREIGQLREEMESLRGGTSGADGRDALLPWVAMAMAAVALALGIIAILRG